MSEYDDSHLRNKEIGILYDVIFEDKNYTAYQNIDGKWVIYNPMKKDHERIIKPSRIISRKQSLQQVSASDYKKSGGTTD